MTKDEVLKRIETIADVKPRVVDSANPRVVMIGEQQLAVKPSPGARSIPLSADGSKNLVNLVGMTARMRKDLSGGTFLKAASELLAAQGQFTVLTRDNIGVDFLGGRHFQAVDPERALRTMESLEIKDYHRCFPQANRSVVIEALGEKLESVVPGDRVRAGVSVMFSPLGTVVPQVSSFSMRLVCTNGATIQEIEETYKADGGGGRDANGFWDWFRNNVRSAYNSIGPMTEKFREMREHRIAPKDRAGAIESIIRSGHLEEMSEAIHARALQEPPRNAWDVMNLVTWAGSHATDDYQQVRRANRAVTAFSKSVTVHKICPLCHSNN